MFSERIGVAEDDEFHAGAGDGHIHATQIAQESYLPFVVAAHQRDDDNVALLTLETVNGVHADESSHGFQHLTAFNE